MTLLQSNLEYSIQFDNENIKEDFSNVFDLANKNLKFGVLNIKINKTQPVTKKRHIVFTTDCSGSMSDICSDGRSKMDHSNHTLMNMIIYFANHPELLVSISVFAFDGSMYTIIENKEINQENVDILIQEIKKIRPKDTTDIEKALINSNDYISNYISTNNDDRDIVHIFMTDGDATQGVTEPSSLKGLASPLVSNVFIGFGTDHNAYLLKELASNSKNNYYFVDALEKAGLVYGEILHSFIYKFLENTNISITNGLLYDWKNNIWVDKINIGDLVSETTKTIHILSENPIDCSCIIETTHSLDKEVHKLELQKSVSFTDLSKFKYRQRTQELLFEVNVHNFNNISCYYDKDDDFWKKQTVNSTDLKEKMQNLLKEMKDHDSDQFIKILCDDIYVCLQTFETKYGAMYSCARQASQGAQRSYSANYNNNHTRGMGWVAPTKLMRSRAYNFYSQEEEEDIFENFQNCNNENEENVFGSLLPNLTLNKPSTDSNISSNNISDNIKIRDIDYEYNSRDALDEYTVSEQTDNPYTSHSILELM